MDAELIGLFTQEGRETEARGLAAAFALVAYADAHLDPREILRFEDLTLRDPFLVNLANDYIINCFQSFCDQLSTHYAEGKERALQAIAEAALVPGVRTALVRVVQLAVVADFRLAEQEELMLDEIAAAAGLPRDRL